MWSDHTAAGVSGPGSGLFFLNWLAGPRIYGEVIKCQLMVKKGTASSPVMEKAELPNSIAETGMGFPPETS